MDGDEGRGGIQVIARAASILRALKDEREGLSLGQIADRVGLPRSTVQRIVGALQAERLVMAASSEGGIRLGPELHALSEAARIDIAEMIRPFLIELSRATEETVDLAVLRGDKLVFLDQVPGTRRLRAVSHVGDTFPLTCTANGKASLALLSEREIEAILAVEWQGETRRRRDRGALMRDIEAARRSGVAFDEDEHTEGISAVGIAFLDRRGVVYSVSVPTPSARFVPEKPMLVREITRVRGMILRALADG